MTYNRSRTYRKTINSDGTFSTRICGDCAYRVGQSCSMCGMFLRNITKCPDGYTIELVEALNNDNITARLTGKHSGVYYNWEPKNPDAKYPARDRTIEDDDEDDAEYMNA